MVGVRVANPSALWLVRHGQSLGNVARDAAHEADLERLDLADSISRRRDSELAMVE